MSNNSQNINANSNYESAIKRIMANKGIVGAVGEKALRNFNSKATGDYQYKMHYFAIGHAFKQIDTKSLFEYKYGDKEEDMVPTKFISLQVKNFTFNAENGMDKLKETLEAVRNINSHFIHTFDVIELNKIDPRVIKFLRESFEAACKTIYTKFKKQQDTRFKQNEIQNKNYQEGIKDLDIETKDFISKVFFDYLTNKKLLAKNPGFNELSKTIQSFTLKQLLEYILFFEVKAEYKIELENRGGTHHAFSVQPGTYLSFEACLFLLTMFLYKNEAKIIVPKLQHFDKENDAHKIDLFCFYAKKFASRDADSEQEHLVKFRDMIQYLNKYPNAWNKYLRTSIENETIKQEVKNRLTENIKHEILKMAVENAYPLLAENQEFVQFAMNYFNAVPQGENNLYLDIIELDKNFYPVHLEATAGTIDLKSWNKSGKKGIKHYILNYLAREYREKVPNYADYADEKFGDDRDRLHAIFATNKAKDKLEKRIAENTLYRSFGRNNDRFMLYAMRFLAETNYFNKETRFKCYQFNTTAEQEDFLSKKEKELGKDYNAYYKSLKFHEGRLFHFCTYEGHKSRYENWDMPFVENDNALMIELNFDAAHVKIPIQRSLMVYLLEHALYDSEPIANKGYTLLANYFASQQSEFKNTIKVLEEKNTISPEEKTVYKKLVPRRLLHQYYFKKPENYYKADSLQTILDKALFDERKYETLKHEAQSKGLLIEFEKQNKGKEFKLQFIKKVTHLMYFKAAYIEKYEQAGKKHHSNFYFTRNEFEVFCRYMYAFDEVPKYKELLLELFTRKGYDKIAKFMEVFNSSKDIHQLYQNLKVEYKAWLANREAATFDEKEKSTTERLAPYRNLFSRNILLINLKHFIEFYYNRYGNNRTKKLDAKASGPQYSYHFNSKENDAYLIDVYYYSTEVKGLNKEQKKLFNELKSFRFEDRLLFEMAMRYVNQDKTIQKVHPLSVRSILQSEYLFEHGKEHAVNNYKYKLSVHFDQIERYAELLHLDNEKRKVNELRRTNYQEMLKELGVYLDRLPSNEKELHALWDKAGTDKIIKLKDLAKVHSHIIGYCLKYIQVLMNLEEYYIARHNLTIPAKGYLVLDRIPELRDKNEDRNMAAHVALPDENRSYLKMIETLEATFKQTVASDVDFYFDFDKLRPIEQNVVKTLIRVIYNKLYTLRVDGEDKLKNDQIEEKHQRARNRYMEKWQAPEEFKKKYESHKGNKKHKNKLKK